MRPGLEHPTLPAWPQGHQVGRQVGGPLQWLLLHNTEMAAPPSHMPTVPQGNVSSAGCHAGSPAGH